MVPLVRLERTRPKGQQILSLSRLPIPPQRHKIVPLKKPKIGHKKFGQGKLKLNYQTFLDQKAQSRKSKK